MEYTMRNIILLPILLTCVLAQCDWNSDGDLDVLDIVASVDCILTGCWDGSQCDWNSDGDIDVLDIVAMVDCVLSDCWSGFLAGCTDPAALNYDPQAGMDNGSCVYPIAYWNFNEMMGDQLQDISDNGHDGTIFNAVWVEGYEGGGLQFGEASHVTIPYSPELQPSQSITIEVIVKLDTIYTNDSQPILSTNHGGGYGLWNFTGNLDIFININGSYQTAETFTGFLQDTWVHLAGTYDGESVRFYLNGTEADEIQVPGEITYVFDNALQMGRDASSGYLPEGGQLLGTLDAVRICPVALIPSQFLVCDLIHSGCTDSGALNYDPEAVIDDGSCEYTGDYNRQLIILYTNDEHGWMVREDNCGGGAEMMGQWREVEGYTEDGPFLILSGGDNWTGPAISTWFEGESMVDMMNAMNYSATAIGNHEFDFGLEGFQARIDQANFPFLSANMVTEDSGELSPFAVDYTIIMVNDVSVGVIGLTTVVADDINFPENVENIDFIIYEPVLADLVLQVREAGAELIIVVAHVCLPELEVMTPLLSDLGVTLIGGGHCRQDGVETLNGVGIIHAGAYMEEYARAVIDFNILTDTVSNMELSLHFNEGTYIDEDVAQVVAYWEDQLDAQLSQVIGYTEEEITQDSDPMFNMITDSWLESIPADISMTNRGGIRQPLPAGDITLEHWVGILPFENYIVQIELTGQELMDNIGSLVVGGMTTIPDYQLQDGTPIDPNQIYSILITNYLYAVVDIFSELDPEPYPTYIHMRQPVIDWIQELNTSPDDPLDNYLDYEPRQ